MCGSWERPEVIRALPEHFVANYEALWVKSMDSGDGTSNHPLSGRAAELEIPGGKATGQWRVNSGEATTMGRRNGPELKTVGKTSRTMRDERAFRLKAKVDKRLRQIAREISAFLEDRPTKMATHRICAGKCKRFGDKDWTYCPNCSGPMREVEADD
jgi:hypothetical protein